MIKKRSEKYEIIEVKLPCHIVDAIKQKARVHNLTLDKSIEIAICHYLLWCDNSNVQNSKNRIRNINKLR